MWWSTWYWRPIDTMDVDAGSHNKGAYIQIRRSTQYIVLFLSYIFIFFTRRYLFICQIVIGFDVKHSMNVNRDKSNKWQKDEIHLFHSSSVQSFWSLYLSEADRRFRVMQHVAAVKNPMIYQKISSFRRKCHSIICVWWMTRIEKSRKTSMIDISVSHAHNYVDIILS